MALGKVSVPEAVTDVSERDRDGKRCPRATWLLYRWYWYTRDYSARVSLWDWLDPCLPERERERERWHMNVHCVYVKRKIISGKSPSLVHSSAACWTKSKSQKLVCRNFGPGCHSVSCQPCWPPSAGSVQPAVESKVKSSKWWRVSLS